MILDGAYPQRPVLPMPPLIVSDTNGTAALFRPWRAHPERSTLPCGLPRGWHTPIRRAHRDYS
jgi:hypothetical protein